MKRCAYCLRETEDTLLVLAGYAAAFACGLDCFRGLHRQVQEIEDTYAHECLQARLEADWRAERARRARDSALAAITKMLP